MLTWTITTTTALILKGSLSAPIVMIGWSF